MEERHTYWKYPWQKYVCLVAGALQLLLLIGQVRDWRKIADEGILSPEALEQYAARASMLALLEGACAALLFSAVVIGAVCPTRAGARKAEGGTLLGLGLLWAIAGPLLPLWSANVYRWEWAGGLALLLASGARMLMKKAPAEKGK